MLSLASRFEEVRAQQRSQESMIAELQSYASKVGNDFSVIEGLRMLDCLRGLGAIRGSVQDTCSTPEQTNRLKRTKEEADRLQKNLDLVLRRHICDSTRSAASKDEYDILVALLGPDEGHKSGIIGGWATEVEYTDTRAWTVSGIVMEYIQYTQAVVERDMEFSCHQPSDPLPSLDDDQPSDPLPSLDDERHGQVPLTKKRSFLNLFRRNR